MPTIFLKTPGTRETKQTAKSAKKRAKSAVNAKKYKAKQTHSCPKKKKIYSLRHSSVSTTADLLKLRRQRIKASKKRLRERVARGVEKPQHRNGRA